jgi:hypothetical protein
MERMERMERYQGYDHPIRCGRNQNFLSVNSLKHEGMDSSRMPTTFDHTVQSFHGIILQSHLAQHAMACPWYMFTHKSSVHACIFCVISVDHATCLAHCDAQ